MEHQEIEYRAETFASPPRTDAEQTPESESRSARRLLAVMAASLLLALPLIGCAESEGPAEKAGEAIDEAAEDMGETLEEAKEDVEDALDDAGDEAEDVGDEIEDAAEDVVDEVDGDGGS